MDSPKIGIPLGIKQEQKEPVHLSFNEALQEILNGNKVTKIEWENKDEYGFLKGDILHIHKNGEDHQWIISAADISGMDYLVLEELN